MLAYYDTSGYLPIDYDAVHLGKAIGSAELKKLFSNDTRSCLTQVSLRNSNLGTIALRGRTIAAPDIQDTVSAFDDHAQICTNVTGYSLEPQEAGGNKRLRRYLGFPRGRVSESGTRCHLTDYEQWLNGIVETLRHRRNPHNTFQRYALGDVDLLRDLPRHILLDLSEVEDTFETVGDGKKIMEGEPLQIDDVSQAITKGGFVLKANGKRCKVDIVFDEKSRRYLLSSSDLDGLYSRKTDHTDKRDLITYLNQEQSFRVIPHADNLIYTLGEFYQPLFKVGPAFKADLFEVSQVLVPIPALREVSEEKGAPVTMDGLPDDTLFGIIDNLGKQTPSWTDPSLFEWVDARGGSIRLQDYFGQPDLLVCDDMGTEAADFIMADSAKRRVVFIHAKANKPRRVTSASALQEVIGQATKNINFLGMFNGTVPDKLSHWMDPWKGPAGLPVEKRIRLGPQDENEAWRRIHEIIRHPLAEREVWLFTGQTLSKSRFEKLLGKPHPDAEALQAAYLLFATLTNVASVGAKLRVFCYP